MMASLSNTSLTTLCEPQDPGARLSTSSLNDVSEGSNFVLQREKEALQVLWTSHDLTEIDLVYCWFPFKDRNEPLEVLSNRLESLFTNANDNTTHPVFFYKGLETLMQRAPDSPSTIWDFRWSPPIATSESCPTRIANAIDSEISSALYRVPFKELVKAACYRPSLAADLYDGLYTTRRELWQRSQLSPQSREKYQLVKTVRPEWNCKGTKY